MIHRLYVFVCEFSPLMVAVKHCTPANKIDVDPQPIIWANLFGCFFRVSFTNLSKNLNFKTEYKKTCYVDGWFIAGYREIL